MNTTSTMKGVDWNARDIQKKEGTKRKILKRPLSERVSAEADIHLEDRSDGPHQVAGNGKLVQTGTTGCYQAKNHGSCFE